MLIWIFRNSQQCHHCPVVFDKINVRPVHGCPIDCIVTCNKPASMSDSMLLRTSHDSCHSSSNMHTSCWRWMASFISLPMVFHSLFVAANSGPEAPGCASTDTRYEEPLAWTKAFTILKDIARTFTLMVPTIHEYQRGAWCWHQAVLHPYHQMERRQVLASVQ